MKRWLILIACSIFVVGSLWAQREAPFVRKGNKEYEAGRFYQAELEYRKAMEQAENSTKAQYNLGGALYKQEKYDEALKSYGALSERTDVSESLRASSLYNLGNSLYKKEQYRESVAAYKEALRLQPGAKDIKYNLSAALRKLQEQQQQQQNNKDQNQQDQQQKDNQDQEQGGQDKNQQQNQDQKEQEGGKDQQQQQQNKSDQKGDPKNQEGQQQKGKAATMSQEDAEQLLKALENQENALQAKIQKEKAKVAPRVKTDKDW